MQGDDEAREPDDELRMQSWAHAGDRVGFYVLPETRHLFSERDLERWDTAVNEYLEAHRNADNGTE